MKTVELKDGQVLQAFGNGRNAYLMDITETYTKKVIIFADSEEEANEEILTADYEMSAKDYLSDSLAWEEPIDVTEDVEVVNDDEDRPFVHLTIVGKDNYEKFRSMLPGLKEEDDTYLDGGKDDMYRFDDIDLLPNLSEMLRALGRMPEGVYVFTTEEGM